MLIVSPSNLHYPVTVTKLLVAAGDSVERNARIFLYEYAWRTVQQDRDGEDFEVVKIMATDFQCETRGRVTAWQTEVGQEIEGPGVPLVEVEEPCRHEVQYAGMCTICGEDMTEISYNQSRPDTDRASVNMFHGNTALKVSEAEASRAEEEAKRRLLSNEKLSLVVDLDQTIIHATVDPTVAEWQSDENNPNHAAVKDVQAFKLTDDGPGARQECWYYIKLRPGLEQFFEEISKMFECHIYTMGTRAYAQNIARIVDPDGKIFGDRILSRDESGSLVAKNLQRLFPVDTKMVVIMDDRADVWKWSANLIRLPAYDFFVGIGDINASFLPKRPDVDTPSPRVEKLTEGPKPEQNEQQAEDTTVAEARTNGTQHEPEAEIPTEQTNGETSTLEQLVSMGGGDDVEALKEKTSQQDETIAAQLADRPLLQKQKILDAEEERASQAAADKESNGESSSDDSSQDEHKYRHNLLQDDDEELIHLEAVLRKVHGKFYTDYKQRKNGDQAGPQLSLVPDVKEIMPTMKEHTFRGVHLVFSGIMPLGVDVQMCDKALWAKSFGATVSQDLSKRTTHVIATPQRKTSKVRKALRHPNRIKVVTEHWLFDSISQWRRLDEKPYLIDFGLDQNDVKNGTETPFSHEDALLSSEDEESGQATDGDDEAEGEPNGTHDKEPQLTVDTEVAEEEEDLSKYAPDEGQQSPITPGDDWEGMENELREFLGSDYDENSGASEIGDDDGERDAGNENGEDDGEGERNRESVKKGINGDTPPGRSTKRKREEGGDPGQSTDGEDSDASTANAKGSSHLQRRKRQALARTSSLTNVHGAGGEQQAAGEGGDEETDSLALEAEIEAELAREMAEIEDE
ncbi:MAG: Carboxy-terminal domain (CTD) phosphatase [Bathelium mastoideum]|nr:MAG: Carboxy-terminal domain (CTD) phosphatase [Bathelium mastoideum]